MDKGEQLLPRTATGNASHVNPVQVIRWLARAADCAHLGSHMPLGLNIMHMSVVTRRAWEGGRVRSDSSQLCDGTTRCRCHSAAMSLRGGWLGYGRKGPKRFVFILGDSPPLAIERGSFL